MVTCGCRLGVPQAQQFHLILSFFPSSLLPFSTLLSQLSNFNLMHLVLFIMYMKLSIAHWEFLDFTIHCDEILIILTCLAFMLLVLMVYFRYASLSLPSLSLPIPLPTLPLYTDNNLTYRFKGWPKFLGTQGTNANVLSAWMNRLKRLVTPAPAPAPAPNVSSPPKKPQVTEQKSTRRAGLGINHDRYRRNPPRHH